MKKYIYAILFSMFSVFSYSQESIQIGNHSIRSNFGISRLLEKHKEKNLNTTEIKGYRIQIISDNDRAKVYNQKSKVYQHFSDFKTYLKYVQPYYKLRIGDFKTRLEARSYLEKVIRVFPSAFIVFDDIKLR